MAFHSCAGEQSPTLNITQSKLNQLASITMRSLKELSKMAVVKYGKWGEEELPETLVEEVTKLEDTIRMSMTGHHYYEYYRRETSSMEFGMSWTYGCWSFTLKKSWQESQPILRTDIRAGTQTFLSPCWAELFRMESTTACQIGFSIYDFVVDAEDRIVTFYGDSKKKFSSSFWFSKTGFFVRVKCNEWDPLTSTYYTLAERCFEQPDTDTWSFMVWDSEFHSPGFHFPLFESFR